MSIITLIVKIIVIIIAVYVAILIISALVDWYIQNQETVKKSVSTICNLDKKILESINDDITKNIKNEQAKEIANKILRGDTVPECDYKLFFDLLDNEERKKLNLLEFTCNFASCV